MKLQTDSDLQSSWNTNNHFPTVWNIIPQTSLKPADSAVAVLPQFLSFKDKNILHIM